MTSAALLLIVVATDLLVGSLPGVRTVLDAPLNAVRGVTRWFDARLNRERRGGEARRTRGLVVVFFVAVFAWIVGAGLSELSTEIHYGWVIDAAVLLILVRHGDCIRRMRIASQQLAAEDFSDARHAVGPMVRYDMATLDNFGVARTAVQGGMAQFTERFLATLFWYILFGLPGAVICRSLNSVAGVIGVNSPRHQSFGFAAARVDYILNLAPAVVAGPIVSMAAFFVPRADAFAGISGWVGDIAERGARPDFRGEGSIAGALGLALGGPRPFGEKTLPGTWIGDGRARATPSDVRRAVFLIFVATLLVAIALTLAVLFGAG